MDEDQTITMETKQSFPNTKDLSFIGIVGMHSPFLTEVFIA